MYRLAYQLLSAAIFPQHRSSRHFMTAHRVHCTSACFSLSVKSFVEFKEHPICRYIDPTSQTRVVSTHSPRLEVHSVQFCVTVYERMLVCILLLTPRIYAECQEIKMHKYEMFFPCHCEQFPLRQSPSLRSHSYWIPEVVQLLKGNQ